LLLDFRHAALRGALGLLVTNSGGALLCGRCQCGE
jgi:hypothetical protein